MNTFHRELLDMVGATDYIATFADPGRPIVDIEPYTYTIDGDTGVNINQVTPQSFLTPMDGDADFVLTYLSGFARNVASTYGATILIPNPALLIQIKELNSGRNFFAGAGTTLSFLAGTGILTPSGLAPMPMVAGQGGFPFLLTSPKVLRARSTLQTTAIACQATTFNGFYLSFHGARIWYG
jgi:hypothetical protein